jgi:ribonuclease E
MLVNATQEEELRVAMVDGQKLYDLDIETPSREQKKGNIYKAKITRVEPSLEAAFVDYGGTRHGFLPLKEVARSYFRNPGEPGGRVNIREALHEGQELVVQVDKEERGTKGAALTTFISLAGRFLVLMPNNPRAGGVSRRIEGDERSELREVLSQLTIPDGMGAIVRTAGLGRSAEELQWDLDYLLNLWRSIEAAAAERPACFLVYQDSNLIVRALRDHFGDEIGEILIDDEELYADAKLFVDRVMPHNARRLKLYAEDVPLFTRFQIESQIESAFSHTVELPSGGSIVIDHTEALVSIDINSARATRGEDIETTALNTNLEAADEIARQLRLRDIGGLIVIDFIDMGPTRNQREVEDRLRDAVKMDRARVQIGRISRFGLLEMSRQRLHPSLGDTSNITCPRCSGRGSIRDVESLSLAILRLIGEEGRKERTAQVVAQLPVDVSTYLLNEKREMIGTIEKRNGVRIILVPNPNLETPNYALRRVRDDETNLPENTMASYRMATLGEEAEGELKLGRPKPPGEEAAVKPMVPDAPVPTPPAPAVEPEAEVEPGGLGARIAARFRAIFGAAAAEAPAAPEPTSVATTPATDVAPRAPRPQPVRDTRARSDDRDRGPRRGPRDFDRRRPRRGDRPERGDRGDRNERGERSDRNDRNDRNDWSERGERGERTRTGGMRGGPRPGVRPDGAAPEVAAAPAPGGSDPDGNRAAEDGRMGEPRRGRGRRGGRRRRRGGEGMSHGESVGPRENGSDQSFHGADTHAGDTARGPDAATPAANRERADDAPRAPRPDVADVAPND